MDLNKSFTPRKLQISNKQNRKRVANNYLSDAKIELHVSYASTIPNFISQYI